MNSRRLVLDHLLRGRARILTLPWIRWRVLRECLNFFEYGAIAAIAMTSRTPQLGRLARCTPQGPPGGSRQAAAHCRYHRLISNRSDCTVQAVSTSRAL